MEMLSQKQLNDLLAPLDRKAAEIQESRLRLEEKNKSAAREMILAIQLSLTRYPLRAK